MRTFNYQKICQELLNDLSPKEKEIISRRFGLRNDKRETLESIGNSFGITRERVRQIEEAGLKKINQKIAQYQKIFQFFNQYLKSFGGLRKEEILLTDLGEKKYQNQIYFLLTISQNFQRFAENEDFYSFWAIDKNCLTLTKNIIETLSGKLREIGHPLSLKELSSFFPGLFLRTYLEISKKILSNSEGLYGLKDWPEINPRGVKDKAYLVFKKIKRPLHFREVADLIGGALVQTVHNELIRDPRFVLVGRGIYALAEWGYYPGHVKDVIWRVIKEAGRPLTKEEILVKVREQRLVKESTILLNLSKKKYFFRNSQGKYFVKEA